MKMKVFTTFIISIVISNCVCAQSMENDNWYNQAKEDILRHEMQFKEHGGKFKVNNITNDLHFEVESNRFDVNRLSDNKQIIGFEIQNISKGAKPLAIDNVKPELIGTELHWSNENIVFEYVNSDKGFRQNFIVNAKPEGTADLSIRMQIASSGSYYLKNNNTLVIDDEGSKYRFSDLMVWDKTGKNLPTKFILNGTMLCIEVDDAGAIYPITVDPIIENWSYQLSTHSANSKLGWNLANVGDVNGDDYDDIVVAASGLDKIYLFYGGALGFASAPDWEYSISSSLIFGKCVSSAGDFDNDGFDDILVGEAQSGSAGGKAYVFYGGVNGPDPISDGYWHSTGKTGQKYGWWVSTAGDFDADGIDDILVGAPNQNSPSTTYLAGAYVWKGNSTRLVNNTSSPASASSAYWSKESSTSNSLGERVAFAGDVVGSNGILISDPYVNSSAGEVYIVLGGTAIVELSPISGPANSEFGKSISRIGDFDEDGYSDFVVGAPAYNSSTNGGAVYVFKGEAFPAIAAYSSYTDAYWTSSYNEANAEFGLSVSAIGDYDGDGYNDLIVGAPNADHGSLTDCGMVRVYTYDISTGHFFANYEDYFGNDNGVWMGYDIAYYRNRVRDRGRALVSAPKTNFTYSAEGKVFLLEDNVTYAHKGYNIQSVGDFDGDGKNDYAVCTEGLGEVDLYFSSTGAVGWSVRIGNKAGVAIASGDFNGDSYLDLAIGEPNYQSYKRGKVRVFLGTASGLDTEEDWETHSNNNYDYYGTFLQSVKLGSSNHDNLVVGTEHELYIWYSQNFNANNGEINTNADEIISGFGGTIHDITTGDLNNDGNSDIAIGAELSDRVYVYMGNSSGYSSYTTIDGSSTYSTQFGWSVSIGDLNGDGFDDLAVGSPHENTSTAGGVVYVWFGYNETGSTMASWSTTSSGATWNSGNGLNEPGAAFGMKVVIDGDFNEDGILDLIVGAPLSDYSPSSIADAGKIRVYSDFTGTPNPDHQDFISDDPQTHGRFGWSLAFAGDLNCDGIYSIAVGSPFKDAATGELNQGYLEIANVPSFNTVNALGTSVSTAGDVNGDGYSDMMVGDPVSGEVMLYYGSASGYGSVADVVFNGPRSFGQSVSTAGDINGDGYSDIIIGAPEYNCTGAIMIYLGGSSGIDNDEDLILYGSSSGDDFGYSVACVGDIDGDGKSEIIIGAPGIEKAYVYKGNSSVSSVSLYWTYQESGTDIGKSVSSAGDFDGDGHYDVLLGAPGKLRVYMFNWDNSTSSLSTTPIFTAHIDASYSSSEFGFAVACAGDVDGDGFSDILIGAPGIDQAFMFLGNDMPAGTFCAACFPSDEDWYTGGNQSGSRFGSVLAMLGDINGDGYGDFAIGAPEYSVTTSPSSLEGQIIIFTSNGEDNGATLTLWTKTEITGSISNGKFSSSIATSGDGNGDGISDYIIGSPGEGIDGNFVVSYGETSLLISDGVSQELSYVDYYPGASEYGHCVVNAGDVNGDGFDDILVSPYNDPTSVSANYPVMLFYGSSIGITKTLNDPDWTFSLNSMPSEQSMVGFSVAGVGDVNNDGYDDFLIGAPNYRGFAGIRNGGVFGFYGSSNGPNGGTDADECDADWRAAGGGARNFNNNISTETCSNPLSNNTGDCECFLLAGKGFGYKVSGAGDINGDGFADVVIAMPQMSTVSYNYGQCNPSGLGFGCNCLYSEFSSGVFIYYGGENGLNATSSLGSCSGHSLALSIVPNSGGTFDLGDADILIQRALADHIDVAHAGDLNGDGFSDLILSIKERATYGNQNPKEYVEVWYGSCDGLYTTVESTPCVRSVYTPSHIANWSCIFSSATDNNEFGYSLSGGEDINGDGYDDVLIGAPLASGYGKAFLYHGSSTGLSGNNNNGVNNDANSTVGTSGAPNWVGVGHQSGMRFGHSVSMVGDLNGMGYGEILVGAPDYFVEDQGEVYPEGIAFVFSAEKNLSIVCPSGCPQSSSTADWSYTRSPNCFSDYCNDGNIGYSVSGAGDVNGDGYSDVLVGAPFYNMDGSHSFYPNHACLLFYGNTYMGVVRNSEIMDVWTGQSSDVHKLINGSTTSVVSGCNASIFHKSHSTVGRTTCQLVWETRGEGDAFSSAGGNIACYTGHTGISTNGFNTNDNSSVLGFNSYQKDIYSSNSNKTDEIRLREKYNLANALDGRSYGQWFYHDKGQRILSNISWRNTGSQQYITTIEGTEKQASNTSCRTCETNYSSCPGQLPYSSVVPIDSSRINIRVYPNPVDNSLTVEANESVSQIVIINMNGQTVVKKNYSSGSTANSNKLSLDVQSLPQGYYQVHIHTLNNVVVKGFVKL